MNRTKIEWCDYTWNPIKGVCPVGCWYCYARRMYKRFGWDEKLDFLISKKDVFQMAKSDPARIFVCSTMEMFHPNIPSHLRDSIFYIIKKNPRHTFIILTKMPENIDRPMPDNAWLGVTVTGSHDMWRIEKLFETLAVVRFVSFEPLLDPAINFAEHLSGMKRNMLNWIILGRLTGHGKARNPEREWIEQFVTATRFYRVPIFMKNNLREIWGSNLIQEFPK